MRIRNKYRDYRTVANVTDATILRESDNSRSFFLTYNWVEIMVHANMYSQFFDRKCKNSIIHHWVCVYSVDR